MDAAWKTVLLNQFHDIIPGSSIRQVYERTEKEYAEVLETARTGMLEAAGKLFRRNEECAVLVNTLSCEWSGAVELPEGWNGALDAGGKVLPAQRHEGRTWVPVRIAGNSFLTLRRGTETAVTETDTEKLVLENERVRYELDEKKRLIRAFDKELGREMLASPGNVLMLYNDRPVSWDAWDIDLYYRREELSAAECVRAGTVKHGEVFDSADLVFRTGGSEITQQIRLARGSKRLDFVSHVDWHEHRKMLRVSFPTAVQTDRASFDIQYGHIERPTHDNTSWDMAKFETCGQRYADLSGGGFGAALLNDCKYGYHVRNSTLDLALLRAPQYPDRFADQGEHIFTYSFLPHGGRLAESAVMQEAAVLNREPVLIPGFEANDAAMPCRLDSDGISLEVVKRAEKDDSLILRLVEFRGQYSSGTLRFDPKPVKVCETDLMEWNDTKSLNLTGNTAELELKPFEIRTLRVDFSRS